MKTTVPACAAAILTSASLIAYTGASSTSAYASPAGLGGGAHPTGTSFGNHVAASIGLTGNRWGPNNTRAFGGPAFGQGPDFNHRTETIPNASGGNVTARCPCVVVHDPFAPKVGGVSITLAKTLAHGVADQTMTDKGQPVIQNPQTLGFETNVEGAVWGAHFDPAAPATEKYQKSDNGVRSVLGSVR